MSLELEEGRRQSGCLGRGKEAEVGFTTAETSPVCSRFAMSMYKGRRRNQRCEYETAITHDEGVYVAEVNAASLDKMSVYIVSSKV